MLIWTLWKEKHVINKSAAPIFHETKTRNEDEIAGGELKWNTLTSDKRRILALIQQIRRGIFLKSLNCLKLKIESDRALWRHGCIRKKIFAPFTRSFPVWNEESCLCQRTFCLSYTIVSCIKLGNRVYSKQYSVALTRSFPVWNEETCVCQRTFYLS